MAPFAGSRHTHSSCCSIHKGSRGTSPGKQRVGPFVLSPSRPAIVDTVEKGGGGGVEEGDGDWVGERDCTVHNYWCFI